MSSRCKGFSQRIDDLVKEMSEDEPLRADDAIMNNCNEMTKSDRSQINPDLDRLIHATIVNDECGELEMRVIYRKALLLGQDPLMVRRLIKFRVFELGRMDEILKVVSSLKKHE